VPACCPPTPPFELPLPRCKKDAVQQQPHPRLHGPVHAAIGLPRVQPELHGEPRGPLEAVGQSPWRCGSGRVGGGEVTSVEPSLRHGASDWVRPTSLAAAARTRVHRPRRRILLALMEHAAPGRVCSQTPDPLPLSFTQGHCTPLRSIAVLQCYFHAPGAPVVDAPHVISVRKRAQHGLEVGVDEECAPVVRVHGEGTHEA